MDTANVQHGSESVIAQTNTRVRHSPVNNSSGWPHAAEMRADQDHTRIKKISFAFLGGQEKHGGSKDTYCIGMYLGVF